MHDAGISSGKSIDSESEYVGIRNIAIITRSSPNILSSKYYDTYP